MIGQTIDVYHILEKRGEGGMGVLYKAHDERLDRTVALKTLHPDLIADPEFREKLGREAKSLARLNHPNIVTVYQYLIQEGHHFIVMEFVEGRTVAEVIAERGPYSFADGAKIVLQILDAIGYAHRNGVVHRDIKPSNILLTAEGVAKVTDFGIAKLLDTEKTRTTYGAGSLFYMSPEQIQHGDVDGRTDIYALGVTFFEMLTRTVPFTAETEFLIMKKHIEEPPPAPSSFNSAITTVQDELILHAMEKSPGKRFLNAEEFANAISDALSFADTGSGSRIAKARESRPRREKISRKSAPGKQVPEPKRSKAWVVYGTIFVLAAVAAYLALKPGPEPKPSVVVAQSDTADTVEQIPISPTQDTTEVVVPEKKPKPDQPPLSAEALTVDVEPFNQRSKVAGIWVDGSRKGDGAPFAIRGLGRGLHWVKIETTFGTLTDTATWTGADRQLSFFLAESYGRVRVSADFPDGDNFADIYIDDRDVGRGTPYEMRELLVGPHKIEVKKDSYRAVGGPRVARVTPTGTGDIAFQMQRR